MQQTGEPSVEEILDSIKKVIARDAAAPARRKASSKLVRPEPSRQDFDDQDLGAQDDADEVLELADLAEQDTLELSEESLIEEQASDDAASDAPASDETETDEEGLIDNEQRNAMRDNFAALAMLSQPSQQPQIVRSGETSLENLTRELLRPMLAEWLDANLPDMVEELIKAEISRIAGKQDRS
jgi:cell pole-organizing protein PopZ